MSLSENIILMDSLNNRIITDRGNGGYVIIGNSQAHVYPFNIPENYIGYLEIQHSNNNSQNWSLQCWFSRHPYGESLYEYPAHLRLWNMSHLSRCFKIYSNGENLNNFSDTTEYGLIYNVYGVPGSKSLYKKYNDHLHFNHDTIYYLNILNLQNSQNAYKILYGTKLE